MVIVTGVQGTVLKIDQKFLAVMVAD